METRTLTPKQIEDLHEYCYFRSVSHYDVQVEIVDHLASSIEKLWETNPEIPFDEAMYKVGEQFGGDLGFSTYCHEKEKAVRRKYRRLLLHYVADYYKFPKIMITLMLTLILYSALYFTKNDQSIIVTLVGMFFGFSLFYGLYYRLNYVQVRTKKGYSFLLNEISIKGLLYKTGILFGGYFIQQATRQIQFSSTGKVLFSVLVSLYVVLLYGDCFFIPQKIREHFEEQFPQFIIH